MSNYATAVGTLRFDPQIKSTRNGRWWLIVECDDDWWEMYARWMEYTGEGEWVRDRNGKLQWKNTKLIRPAWGAHISVLRGERPRANLDKWRRLEGAQVEFRFDPYLHRNEEYWWLNVECPRLLDIRESFGLPREPRLRLHLTVGRIEP